ncbi:MAG: phenylalanine--tRNA ligase subunit beta, partial [Candidatus Dormibacterales bacterium]
MRVSFEWLSDFADLDGISPRQAAELLTMHGFEVSAVREVDLAPILVGRVVSQEPHPRSRTPLWVHQVDLGGETVQIIAGAANAVPGALVPVALPGVVVPRGTRVRESFNVAGVAGAGMLCSAAELEMGDDHSGILILDEGAPGQSLAELFPRDAVMEAEVLSNRPDCLGHMGIARELAAAARRPLKQDFMPLFTGGVDPPGTELVEVVIEEPSLCRRYIGAPVSGVTVQASPPWMRRRLRAAGVRPINNVVDVTNYVLLEYGQPLHAFDLARLAGPAVRVRRAREGERLACLDGETRALDPTILVIADAERPIAVAGVIGGEESAVTGGTREVLLESANFDGPAVRAAARSLGLRTEASARFERSLSPELALAGARRAAALLSEVAGGSVHREWPDRYPRPQQPVAVRLRPERVDDLLGVHVPLEESESILQRLGFHLRVGEDGAWDVLPPVFRLDVSIPEDVVEEIGRIHGYERVPATLPGARRDSWHVGSADRPLERVRALLAGAGLQEAVTPALVSLRRLERLGVAARALRCLN